MGIDNLSRREVGRADSRQTRSMVGIVDSYDPNEHAVKVKFLTDVDDNGQPRISGWLRIRPMSAGAGSSLVVGPSVGDQCVVEHHEGDSEGGHVVGFLHNDVDRPPTVQSGELLYTQKTGAQIHVDANGVTSVKGAGGSTTVHDASGHITHTDNAGKVIHQKDGKVFFTELTASVPIMLQSGPSSKLFGVG